jgi:hypothetical protein
MITNLKFNFVFFDKNYKIDKSEEIEDTYEYDKYWHDAFFSPKIILAIEKDKNSSFLEILGIEVKERDKNLSFLEALGYVGVGTYGRLSDIEVEQKQYFKFEGKEYLLRIFNSWEKRQKFYEFCHINEFLADPNDIYLSGILKGSWWKSNSGIFYHYFAKLEKEEVSFIESRWFLNHYPSVSEILSISRYGS